ncbi:MAG: CofH family radical SAM protein [Chlamydiae bacterium]|nr:CofH family radical SAM protein [Chlamydiota bacterium]
MLKEIFRKIENRERLSFEEGLYLFKEVPTKEVGQLADRYRQLIAGDTVYYATTLFIHPTNLCELSCPMCSYYAKPGWKNAWFMTPLQVEEKVRAHLKDQLTEIHIVGGLWRDCDLTYYEEIFTRIKSLDPNLHIKAMTPVEYDFLAKLHNIPIEDVFLRLIKVGLGSLPGGGAEVLVEKIRKQVAPQKISSDEYLEIHQLAHRLGLPSNITMLFGHVEEYEDLLVHMIRVRELQDKTGGFQTFVPLKYHDENNALGKRKGRLKTKDIYKVYAISRLMIDNVPNLKVLWNYTGIETAKELLKYGVNDLSSTALGEKIITMAGGVQLQMNIETLDVIIRQAGRIPHHVHSGFICALA